MPRRGRGRGGAGWVSRFPQAAADAARALCRAYAEEPHLRVHALAAGGVAFWAWLVRMPAQPAAILALTAALVLALEAMNSALERVVDLVTTARHPQAGRAKELASGAVLVAAAGSLAVAALLLLPTFPDLLAALAETGARSPGGRPVFWLGVAALAALVYGLFKGGTDTTKGGR